MRLVYVTSSYPYGRGEGFLTAELRELERQGHDVTIVPTLARGPLVHEDARAFVPRTRCVALLSPAVAASALRTSLAAPARSLELLVGLRRSRSTKILAKNIAVYPKGLWLAAFARELGVDHIHAHWGGTSATLAMFASGITGLPWSLTVHRWDIREDNLLRPKLHSASFVRAVSGDGLHDLERIVGPTRTPALVLHMGVPLPAGTLDARGRRADEATLRVLVPAGLLEVKGHRYLVDAIRMLRSRGTHVLAGLAGTGPLRAQIAQEVAEAGVADECVLLGQLSHSELLRQLEDGEWDAVALASVETASGEKEGIPVAFLEAMSYGLPVVGTAVGGIPELLGDGAGLLVPSRDAVALADAIERLARDPALRARLGRLGRERVERDFSIESVVRELAAQFELARKRRSASSSPSSSRLLIRRRRW